METLIRKLAEAYSLPYEKVKLILQRALYSMKPKSKVIEVMDAGETVELVVKRTGVGPLKTESGKFYLYVFEIDDTWEEYFVLVKVEELNDERMPVFKDKNEIILRIDSGCETGQRFHDNTCECSQQLNGAMEMIDKRGEGIIINIPNQDGRGKGLPFKLATLELQEELDFDTVLAAAVMLQLDARDDAPHETSIGVIDSRTYAGCLGILKFFGIPASTKIILATNNPKKTEVFTENGYQTQNLSIIIPPTESTKKHLLAKQNWLGHYLFL